jgi:hypothetical protein
MPDPATSRPSRARPWLWAAGAVLLVAAAGAGAWRLPRTPTSGSASATTAPSALTGLEKDHDYYVHVKLIEVTERMPGNKPWDRADGSGPDLRFSLTWRGNVIWKSIEKPDTLIGSWDLMKVDLRQMMITGGGTDIEGLINAPLIHYTPGEAVALKVWDEDTIGSDDAGSLTLKLEDLRPGDNTLVPSGPDAKALKRVVVTIIDRRTPLPDLLTMISNR